MDNRRARRLLRTSKAAETAGSANSESWLSAVRPLTFDRRP
jgi:hypothetical protein